MQERLTSQIADALMRRLSRAASIVVIEAEHLCMSMRGIRKPGAPHDDLRGAGHVPVPAAHPAEAMSLILGR